MTRVTFPRVHQLGCCLIEQSEVVSSRRGPPRGDFPSLAEVCQLRLKSPRKIHYKLKAKWEIVPIITFKFQFII